MFSERKISKAPPVITGSKEISWDVYLGKYDVIRLVMTDFMDGSDSVQDMLDYLTEEVTEDLQDEFPDLNFGSRITLRTIISV